MPSLALTDEELMKAYQSGDAAAFEVLYERYSERVYAYLQKRVFDKFAVDDLFQAAFLKLHHSRHLYSDRFLFAPWLFTICRTSLLDHLKKNRLSKNHEELEESRLPSAEPSEAMRFLSESLANLPDQQRRALELRYQDGLEFAQIAERLQTSPANVRQLISRAMRKLRGKS